VQHVAPAVPLTLCTPAGGAVGLWLRGVHDEDAFGGPPDHVGTDPQGDVGIHVHSSRY
jgi:hypothetical protein